MLSLVPSDTNWPPEIHSDTIPPGKPRKDGVMTRSDLSPRDARQAAALGVLPSVLDNLRLNEVCECGEVPGSLECRARKHKKRPRPLPWESEQGSVSLRVSRVLREAA